VTYDPNKTAFYVLEQDNSWLTYHAPAINQKLLLAFLSPASAKFFVGERGLGSAQLVAIAAKEVPDVITSMLKQGVEGAAIDMDSPGFDGIPHPITQLDRYKGLD
jgi:hypothetical protein